MTQAIDTFSARRALAYGRMFSPLIKYQIMLWPLFSIATAVLSIVCGYHVFGIFVIGLLSMLMALLVYFGPLVFAFGPDVVLETAMPVKWSEKAAFVLVYSLIVLPALVYVPYYAITFAVNSISPSLVENNLLFSMQQLGLSKYSILTSFQTLVPAAVCVLAVVMYSRRRVLMSVVWTLVSLVAMSISGFVMGLLAVFKIGVDDVVSNPAMRNSDEFVEIILNTMTPYIIVLAALAVVFVALVVWMICRRFKNRQI